MRTKTKAITFRMDEQLHDFLHEFARENGVNVSDLVRNVLIYFHVGFMVGEFGKNIKDLKKEWARTYQKNRSRFSKLKNVKEIIEDKNNINQSI